MSIRTLAFLITLLSPIPAVVAEGMRTGSFADALARMCSSDVREADARLEVLERDLSGLPKLAWIHRSPRHGFHSGALFEQSAPQWIQIDLEESYPIDMIAVVAADVRSPSAPELAHAFPLRFKLEISDRADMSEATVIVDQTAADFPNPGRFPLVYGQQGQRARYVRFTSTKHWPTRDGEFIWALGEIMVLSGNRNVALQRPATAESPGLELGPNWMMTAINDGHSIVGTPVSAKASPTYGYRSSQAESDLARRWVTVDLGKEHALEEVRLVPAWPSEVAYEAGMGFPKSWRLLLSNDPEFKRSAQLSRSTQAANPRNNPVTITVDGQVGRYLRLEASRLWKHGDMRLLALSEIEVFSNGVNVARGTKVTASDVMEDENFSRWSPEFLVDGFSSKDELVPWQDYFRALVRRGSLEREQARLELARNSTARQVADATILGGSIFAVVTLLALIVVMARQQRVRLRDREQLRTQIARDLHDELGSDLGSISLLSELGSRLADLPEEVRKDFAEIHKTAEKSGEAVRDIVWLIESGSSTLRELVAKMREAAERLLGDLVTLKVTPEDVEECELPLLFRRHALFSFKEGLNNVRRHAGAEKVDVTIDCGGGSLLFVIEDDGVGFRVDERLGPGHGLKNLKQRALHLKGRCDIVSRPEGGTTIRFEAPLRTRIYGANHGSRDPSLAG